MYNIKSLLAVLGAAALLAGCAHPISLTPKATDLPAAQTTKIDKGVGLAITEADRAKTVVSPGGGGDKVEYYPYRDLELGLYQALSDSFTRVSRVTGTADPKVGAEHLSYVVRPDITTTSSSPSPFTWPPTQFTVSLTCTVMDANGNTLKTISASGEGHAEFDEFKSDFSLSARRASASALSKLIEALRKAAPELP
jgi:hypothetical protein